MQPKRATCWISGNRAGAAGFAQIRQEMPAGGRDPAVRRPARGVVAGSRSGEFERSFLEALAIVLARVPSCSWGWRTGIVVAAVGWPLVARAGGGP